MWRKSPLAFFPGELPNPMIEPSCGTRVARRSIRQPDCRIVRRQPVSIDGKYRYIHPHVVGQLLTDFSPRAFGLAGVSGLLEVTGLAIWGIHLWRVMSGQWRTSATVEARSRPAVVDGPIQPGNTVAAVLDRDPGLLDTFVQHGFTMLSNPRLRRSIARVVTIEQACRRMDVDCGQFVDALNRRREEIYQKTGEGSQPHDLCCHECSTRAAHAK